MALCKDRRRLAEQFALAAREYSEAVARLAQHEGPSSNVEYGALLSAMNETRQRCECAGADFEQHVAMHNCGEIANKSRFAASARVPVSAGI
jgi:hypothetical protein